MLQTPTLHLQFSERDRKHTEIKRPWGRLGALASLHTSILLPWPLLLAFNLVPLPGTPPLGTSSGPADRSYRPQPKSMSSRPATGLPRSLSPVLLLAWGAAC